MLWTQENSKLLKSMQYVFKNISQIVGVTSVVGFSDFQNYQDPTIAKIIFGNVGRSRLFLDHQILKHKAQNSFQQCDARLFQQMEILNF